MYQFKTHVIWTALVQNPFSLFGNWLGVRFLLGLSIGTLTFGFNDIIIPFWLFVGAYNTLSCSFLEFRFPFLFVTELMYLFVQHFIL